MSFLCVLNVFVNTEYAILDALSLEYKKWHPYFFEKKILFRKGMRLSARVISAANTDIGMK